MSGSVTRGMYMMYNIINYQIGYIYLSIYPVIDQEGTTVMSYQNFSLPPAWSSIGYSMANILKKHEYISRKINNWLLFAYKHDKCPISNSWCIFRMISLTFTMFTMIWTCKIYQTEMKNQLQTSSSSPNLFLQNQYFKK